MKYKIVLTHLLIIIGLSCTFQAQAQEERESVMVDAYCVDSIMSYVRFYAPYYERAVSEYRAKQYIHVYLNIERRNFFIRYLPQLFRPRKNVRKYVVETFSETHFTAPNIYDQRLVAITGTTPRLRSSTAETLKYFNLNIYSQLLINNKIISPFSQKSRKYYKYKLEKVKRNLKGELEFVISYKPRRNSIQTVRGYFIVTNKVWSIREFKFKGHSEYFEYANTVRLGEVGARDELLHKTCKSKTIFRFLGNKVRSDIDLAIEYEQIKIDPFKKKIKRDNKYDLTESFTLQTNDTVQRTRGDFKPYRKIPLPQRDIDLYNEFEKVQKRDSISLLNRKKKSRNAVFWGTVGDVLISNSRVKLDDMGSVKFSPLLNPFLLSYSGRDGWSYKYKLRYNLLFKRSKLLSITPIFGYKFGSKEFFWKTSLAFQYYPQKRGRIDLDVGNGNVIYSSEILNDLKGENDSINFDNLNLTYFKSLHLNLLNTIEIANGLELGTGLAFHRRMAVKTAYHDSLTLDKDFSGRYVYIAPRLKLMWTPGMYSYRDGRRKVYLHSKYPTFTLDWEKGIKGLFSSTGSYERVELDIQHSIPVGLVSNFSYRLGGGMFTDQDQVYFVDFIYFARKNLPEGWNDDIGGTFQLLESNWYNASRYYARANFVYETPMLLLPHVRGFTKWVLKERIYVNTLMMNQLKPYIEVGYGIGTHIFDFGVFMGSKNWRKPKFGFKITFELFNR